MTAQAQGRIMFDTSGMVDEPKSFWTKVGEVAGTVAFVTLGLVVLAGDEVVKGVKVAVPYLVEHAPEAVETVVDFAKDNPGLLIDMATMAVGVPVFPAGMLVDQMVQHKRANQAAEAAQA